jgi:hypothetical protein
MQAGMQRMQECRNAGRNAKNAGMQECKECRNAKTADMHIA